MKYELVVIVLVLSVATGCTTLTSGGQEYIEARVVEDVPDDAPVTSYDDERIADVEPIQDVVEKAANGADPSVRIEVSSAEAQEAREALESVPHYEGEPGGFYVRKGNRTFVITFLKEQ